MPKLRRNSFDDSAVRTFAKGFFKKKFGVLLDETPQNLKVIDLTGRTETILGVEVERGGWGGDFWETDSYSLISKLDFRTINVPIRKEKHWKENPIRWGKERHNPSFKHNIFLRTNKDFTQVIIIRPETIRDPNMALRTKFQPNNSNEIEEWLSFRKENVETYSLTEGTWKLEKKNEIQ